MFMKFHTQLDKNYFRSVVFASVYCIMGIYQVPGSPWDQIGVIVVERMFNYSLITVDVLWISVMIMGKRHYEYMYIKV